MEGTLQMSKKHRVSFVAEKKISVPVDVAFKTKGGEKVAFAGHKKVTKPVRVTFRAKTK